LTQTKWCDLHPSQLALEFLPAHNQHALVEFEEIDSAGILAAKFELGEAPVAQQAPEAFLGIRRIFTEVAGEVASFGSAGAVFAGLPPHPDCTLAKLAVELDGGGHGFPDQRARDDKRNQFLASQGIKVLRFWNHQLRGELEAVRFEIWHALMERTGQKERIAGFKTRPAPSPQPSPPMGEREPERPARS